LHHEAYEHRLATFPALPGIERLLESAKSLGLKVAAVSGSTRHQVQNLILDRLGILRYYDLLITHEDYTAGKPNPEPYLVAAQRLNIEPQACIVIEDASVGIDAGKSAGAYVIGVRSSYPQDLSGADQIVDTLNEIRLDDLVSKK
jgi:HAD superfamily hydrolase (TIGR01509 family)